MPKTIMNDTTEDLLLEWSRKRTAERGPGISMSALGGCRRKAGYLVNNVAPTNASESVQSAMGQAIHEKVAEIAREIAPDDLIEHAVTFAGIPGTLDRYRRSDRTLIDTKTTSSRWLENLKLNGPGHTHIWQTSGYAAALIYEKIPVDFIEIHYLARDTGEQWVYRQRFNPRDVRDALYWLKNVRDTDVAMLPRDFEPDSVFCRNCPFRDPCWGGAVQDRSPLSVLFIEDPDAEKWAKQLREARAAEKEAKKQARLALGALDAIRPQSGMGRVQCGKYTLDFRSNGVYFVAGAAPIPSVGYDDGDGEAA